MAKQQQISETDGGNGAKVEDGQLDVSLVGEIDEAVENLAADGGEGQSDKDEKISGEGEDVLPDADDNKSEKQQGKDENDGGNDGGADDSITDDLLERAVKAGVGVAEAKSFATKSALERVCGLLEARAKSEDTSGGGKTAVTEDAGSNPAEDIPDLDPEKYDENIVAGFKAMKALIGQQHKTIQDLQSSEAKARSGSEFESLLASKPGIDAQSRPAIEAKFNFLTKAYKADGVEVKSSDVLEEALAIVVGKEAGKSIEKTEKLESRAKQHIQRASKAPGKPTTDPWSDVAAEVDEKFSKP